MVACSEVKSLVCLASAGRCSRSRTANLRSTGAATPCKCIDSLCRNIPEWYMFTTANVHGRARLATRITTAEFGVCAHFAEAIRSEQSVTLQSDASTPKPSVVPESLSCWRLPTLSLAKCISYVSHGRAEILAKAGPQGNALSYIVYYVKREGIRQGKGLPTDQVRQTCLR